MALRVISPARPRPRGRPSPIPLADWWQVAQAMVLFPDSRGSKKRSLPRVTLSAVWGLSAGTGTAPNTAAARAGRALSVLQATAATPTATASGMTMSHGQRGPMLCFPLSERPLRNAGNLAPGSTEDGARDSAYDRTWSSGAV